MADTLPDFEKLRAELIALKTGGQNDPVYNIPDQPLGGSADQKETYDIEQAPSTPDTVRRILDGIRKFSVKK